MLAPCAAQQLLGNFDPKSASPKAKALHVQPGSSPVMDPLAQNASTPTSDDSQGPDGQGGGATGSRAGSPGTVSIHQSGNVSNAPGGNGTHLGSGITGHCNTNSEGEPCNRAGDTAQVLQSHGNSKTTNNRNHNSNGKIRRGNSSSSVNTNSQVEFSTPQFTTASRLPQSPTTAPIPDEAPANWRTTTPTAMPPIAIISHSETQIEPDCGSSVTSTQLDSDNEDFFSRTFLLG